CSCSPCGDGTPPATRRENGSSALQEVNRLWTVRRAQVRHPHPVGRFAASTRPAQSQPPVARPGHSIQTAGARRSVRAGSSKSTRDENREKSPLRLASNREPAWGLSPHSRRNPSVIIEGREGNAAIRRNLTFTSPMQ